METNKKDGMEVLMAKTIACYILVSFILSIFSVTPSPAATGTVDSMSPPTNAFGPSGSTGVITVNAAAPWTASTEDNWITITSGSSFNGNGSLSYTVSYNSTGMPRTGTIAVGNQYFTIRQPATDFLDNMNASNWPYPYINSIYAAGITHGCGNNNFCSSDPVTREQMAAFVIRALLGENFTYTQQPYFMDVPATGWSYQYVQKMKDLGLTTNTGSYDASGTVTREQMAAFIIRAMYGENFEYPATPYFSDVPASAWSFKYVQKMKEQGFTENTGTYAPSGVVTREQMAAFISRAFLGVMSSSLNVPSNNSAFNASMIMGKSLEFSVPNSGSMMYKFNEDGTFSGTVSNTGMMGNITMGNITGKWMINSDGTLAINNVQGMMSGYWETYTLMGGGGVTPLMVNYMYSTGTSGSNLMMSIK
jgi:hypothetical protein